MIYCGLSQNYARPVQSWNNFTCSDAAGRGEYEYNRREDDFGAEGHFQGPRVLQCYGS